MNRESLAGRIQGVMGMLMIVEAEARRLGMQSVAEHLEVARSFVVAAAQRAEAPLEDYNTLEPAPPEEGPPLPKRLGIRWPWHGGGRG